MLSLPAACVLWYGFILLFFTIRLHINRALIFYFFAILRFTMHPIDIPSDDYRMPLTLTILLQVAITISTLSDLICLICTYTTLKGYGDGYDTSVEVV